MKCSDVDRILPDLVDGVPIGQGQDLEVQSHLRNCPACSDLVSDLKLIASESRQLAASEEPSPRVWARIAIELKAEGLIREPEFDSVRPVLLRGHRSRWNSFWLAPVAVAVLAAGSYVLVHHPSHHATAQVIQQPVTQEVVVQPSQTQIAQQSTSQLGPQSPSQQPANHDPAQQMASTRTLKNPAPAGEKTPEPAEEAQAASPVTDNEFLTEVSERAPTMRATYANQLQAVNSEIRETKAYLSQYPGDTDARQHLLEVYEQKAILYQMALDRIQ